MKYYIKDGVDIYEVEAASKCIEIELSDNLNAYPIVVDFRKPGIYSEHSVGIIDTGAANTAITIKALFGTTDDIQYKIIKDAIAQSAADEKIFSSAKGNMDIIGILSVIPQIKIGNLVIDNFPFYLIDDRDTSRILIGYDFVSSCDVVQIRNSTILYYNFDIETMRKKMLGTKVFNLMSMQQ